MSRGKENISNDTSTFKAGAGQRSSTHTRRDIKKMSMSSINPNGGQSKKSEGKQSKKSKG
jgi:hypothetical protein